MSWNSGPCIGGPADGRAIFITDDPFTAEPVDVGEVVAESGDQGTGPYLRVTDPSGRVLLELTADDSAAALERTGRLRRAVDDFAQRVALLPHTPVP